MVCDFIAPPQTCPFENHIYPGNSTEVGDLAVSGAPEEVLHFLSLVSPKADLVPHFQSELCLGLELSILFVDTCSSPVMARSSVVLDFKGPPRIRPFESSAKAL
ncbi:hypothetical protein RF11_09332 [Thelohanellus kitauei]|uniref:Uncharacterized protein n=1 Tax=Thelohanellus kitauei TaxID=669202 RepID=A0A0C2MI24_THEKT|nr:hypothetical protein RF11_09332 [Thelohanellus kitauei]